MASKAFTKVTMREYIVSLKKFIDDVEFEMTKFQSCVECCKVCMEKQPDQLNQICEVVMMFIFQYHSLVSGNIFNFLDHPPLGHLNPEVLQFIPFETQKISRMKTKMPFAKYLSRRSIEGVRFDCTDIVPWMLQGGKDDVESIKVRIYLWAS
jgi:hypothetical protein